MAIHREYLEDIPHSDRDQQRKPYWLGSPKGGRERREASRALDPSSLHTQRLKGKSDSVQKWLKHGYGGAPYTPETPVIRTTR